jgi:hypothetical protein
MSDVRTSGPSKLHLFTNSFHCIYSTVNLSFDVRSFSREALRPGTTLKESYTAPKKNYWPLLLV